MRDEGVAVPELHDIEMLASVRGRLHGRKISADTAHAILADHAALTLSRHSHLELRSRIWELRDNLTSYDAAYIALAERLGATLITADSGMRAAPGIRCQVELLTD